jgi:hypothetical protein
MMAEASSGRWPRRYLLDRTDRNAHRIQEASYMLFRISRCMYTHVDKVKMVEDGGVCVYERLAGSLRLSGRPYSVFAP